MVKEARPDMGPWSLRQHYTCATFLVCVLLIGLSVFLLLFSSRVICPSGEKATKSSGNVIFSPSLNAAGPTPFGLISQVTQRGKCDLFDGEWVPYPPGPVYTNQSCLWIETYENCMLNGRLDTGYLYWRWKPRGCDLPLFNAERFVNAMRNTWWALLGDSISRNHMQSLVCLLSQVEKPIMVFHDEQWMSTRWYFSSYNLTLSYIWSPFLVKADIVKSPDGVSAHVHLDTLHDEWSLQLKNFDFVVASGGKWFLNTAIYYENNKVVGCHYCPGKNLPELGYDHAYRKVLNLVLQHMASSDFKGTFLFRTCAPDHFVNGYSLNGGYCNRTEPFKDGDVTLAEVDKVLRNVEIEAFEQATVLAWSYGVDFRLMDMTYLSLLRPDGHPGPYKIYQPFAKDKKAKVENDCLHWCLPGPIDHWNDILMEMALNQGHWDGRSRLAPPSQPSLV